MSTILPYFSKTPSIAPSVFIAPGACVIGDVSIGEESGIWFNCVIRGDVQSVTIGRETNVQDGTVIHVTRQTGPTWIGARVTIGHKALLHACTVEDDAFIGMGAILMDGVVLESGGMVAAGALVPPKKRIKKGEIWAGNPAKLFRMMTEEEAAFIAISAENYRKHAEEYKALSSQSFKMS